MENIVIFTINVLFLFLVWHVGFKPAIKARKRVDLMILKKEVDKHFYSTRSKATNPMQSKLNGIIENTSRALDVVSLTSYLAWSKEVQKHQDLKKNLSDEIKEKFHTNDAEEAKLIEKVRAETSMIGVSFMIETSFLFILAAVIYAIYYFISETFRKGRIQMKQLKPDVEAKAESWLDPDFIVQKSFLINKTC